MCEQSEKPPSYPVVKDCHCGQLRARYLALISRLRSAESPHTTKHEAELAAERFLDDAYAIALETLKHRATGISCLTLKAEIMEDLADPSGDIVHQLAIHIARDIKDLLTSGE